MTDEKIRELSRFAKRDAIDGIYLPYGYYGNSLHGVALDIYHSEYLYFLSLKDTPPKVGSMFL